MYFTCDEYFISLRHYMEKDVKYCILEYLLWLLKLGVLEWFAIPLLLKWIGNIEKSAKIYIQRFSQPHPLRRIVAEKTMCFSCAAPASILCHLPNCVINISRNYGWTANHERWNVMNNNIICFSFLLTMSIYVEGRGDNIYRTLKYNE